MAVDEDCAFGRGGAVAGYDDGWELEVLFSGLGTQWSGVHSCTEGGEFGDEEFGHLRSIVGRLGGKEGGQRGDVL